MALIKDDLLSTIREASNTLVKCMAIVTATELCGSFITGKTGNGTTRENFLAFWKSSYMPTEYHDLSELFYNILRNGVSHSFVVKGGVIPSGDERGARDHLKFFLNGIFVYVPTLAKDVENGILMLLEDIHQNKNELKIRYKTVLNELVYSGMIEYKKYCSEKSIQVINYAIPGDIHDDVS